MRSDAELLTSQRMRAQTVLTMGLTICNGHPYEKRTIGHHVRKHSALHCDALEGKPITLGIIAHCCVLLVSNCTENIYTLRYW